MNQYTSLFILIFSLVITSFTEVIADAPPPVFENDHFRLRLRARTPNQIAAFYEARGFPKFAIDKLKHVCFIGIGLKNKTRDIVKFDLANWRFHNREGAIKRYRREDWRKTWLNLGLAQRFQSTFRWTLMPERLDFQAFETEGGNIILPRSDLPFTVNATVIAGKKNQAYKIEFNNVQCANDTRP